MNRRKLKKIVYNLIIAFLVLGGIGFVLSRFVHFGRVEYTNNAQVRRHVTAQNARVGGFIREIRFEEFQQVRKGDTLVVIEDAEFRLQVAQAAANLESARAGRTVTTASVSTSANNILVSDASIEEVRIELENARREWERYERLLGQEAVTRQQYDNVRTAYEALQAKYDQMTRLRRSNELVRNEQATRLEQSEAVISLAEAALDLARLNLSYTVITATCDGVVGRKEINVGQLVQPGQTMVDIVDSGETWVVANYRETQLKNIEVGMEVRVEADAVPGVVYKGVVERIADGTGTAFSIVPQDNATGNFVKVEQRVPVRISLDGNSDDDLRRLKAGLNVECEVRY